MKILFVQNTDWIKRNPAQQHHLAELLSLRGHEIRVIDFDLLWREENKREIMSKREIFPHVSKIYPHSRVTVIRPPIIKIPFLDYISAFVSQREEIEHQIHEFNPDILVGFGIFAYNAGKIAKKYHLPFLYYWIDVSHRLIPSKVLQPVGRFFEKRNLQMADKILVINKKLQSYVISLGSNPDKTEVLGAGINIDRYNQREDGKPVRAEYSINPEDFVLFFMGWLYHFSGLKEIIAAIAKKPTDMIKLLIVGDGDAYQELKNLSNIYGITDKIILTGKKQFDDLPRYIAAADVCILPAYPWEPIMQDIVPIKIYEYMAMGKPVISTKLPGVMTEFGDKSGICYVEKPEDVIQRALELKKTGKIFKLGDIARRHIENFSWKKITDRFEEILNEYAAMNINPKVQEKTKGDSQ